MGLRGSPHDPSDLDFPGLIWGTASSSVQTEGASPADTWMAWERAGRAPASGTGTGFATRYAEDFARLTDLGITDHRLSINWARVEPEPGRRDPEAVEHYRRVADLTAVGWPATGRVVRLPMWGLSQRELLGDPRARSVIDRIVEDGPAALRVPARPPDLADYVDAALRGGFPEAALQNDPRIRRRWLTSYVDEIVVRDGALLDGGRDPARLRRYLQAWAANTAGAPEHKTLYQAAEINRLTAIGYDRLLQGLLVVEALPAWSTNRISRLTTAPKRHLIEPALVGPLLGVDSRGVLRDPDLIGRLLESFVLAQIRPELSVSEFAPRIYHLRQQDGRHEIDLMVELADGRIIAFEIKAAATATPADARHLCWLRDQIGDRLVRGIVLHAGPHSYPLAEKIDAAPVCTLWSD